MALPSLDKTWQFNVNNKRGNIPPPSGSNLEDHRDMMFMIKQSLIGETFAGVSLGWTGVWSVESSNAGDGVDFGVGDRWVNTNDIVWANTGVNHSWIVFRQAATGQEFCVDCDSTESRRITLTWSPAARYGAAHGGTDGTATDRPTASDEMTLRDPATQLWIGGQQGEFAACIHTMISTDGECTRVIAQIQNETSLFWLFDLAKNPVSGWTNPSIATVLGSINSTASITEIYDLVDNDVTYGIHGSIPMTMYMGIEGVILEPITDSFYMPTANEIDGSWPMLPIGLISEVAGARGRHGEVYDLWFGAQNQQPGTTYPDNLTRQFVYFDEIILPWDGSAPQVIG
jgi:hypothetical protein